MKPILRKGFCAWSFFLIILWGGLIHATVSYADATIDNGDAATSSTGAWSVSGGSDPFDPADPGADALWARGGDDTYTWRFTASQTGTYEVWEWHSGWSTRTTAAPHQITHAGGTTNVAVNQSINAGQWNSLGEYMFVSGQTYSVTVTSVADSSSTCADAMRWTLVSGSDNLPPTAQIDSITPNPAEEAALVSFDGHGSDSDGSVVGFLWHSSRDGDLSTEEDFTTTDLSVGVHTITFAVEDEDGAWSDPVSRQLTVNASGTSDESIRDNGDSGTASTGGWSVSGGSDPFDPADPGADSLWARGGDDTYTWRFTASQTGTYEVWEWHSGWSTRTTAAPHQITHAGGTTNVAVNQSINAGQWNSLGEYMFVSGQTYSVTVTSVADSSSTCADAMRWTLVSGSDNLPPTAQIDSITPNPAEEAALVSFDGHGSDSDGSVVGFLWHSSRDGDLSTEEDFTTTDLSVGVHTITFAVEDEDGAWSDPVSRQLTVNASGTSDESIRDNGDSGTASTGGWSVSGGSDPFNPADPGADSLWARGGDDTYTWRFTASQTGTYEVWEWHSGWSTRTTAAPHQITHAGGTTNVAVNQSFNAGQWNSLGEYMFVSGQTYSVTVTSVADGSSTCADAMRWTLVSGSDNLPPTAQIDSITPNPAEEAALVSFDGHGSDSDGSVVGFLWHSSRDGDLSTEEDFTTTDLSVGVHTITFAVEDEDGAWSDPVSRQLTVNASGTSDESIRDNGDSGTASTGGWSVSGGSDPFDPADPGADSLWARGGDDTYTWRFTASQTGTYEVWEWHSGWSTRTTAAPHQITHAGGTTNVAVNQSINAGQWNSLGEYMFVSGQTYSVTVTSVADGSSTCADAMRWTLVSSGGNLPPTAQIDSISPNPAIEGQPVTFSGHGNDIDGIITAYRWTSSMDGILNYTASFVATDLSPGSHAITFEVRDNEDSWSAPFSANLTVNSLSADEEHIYYCIGYGCPPVSVAEAWLEANGARIVNGLWQYTNSADKTFIFHFVQDQEGMRQALMTEKAHVLYRGHANYGLGAIFATAAETSSGIINDIYTIDDPRIFNISSPWIHVNVRGLRTSQAFPNWWPIFRDGTSGIMNYDFGETTGTPPYYYDTPPYNYYITYQIPGDPSGTHYLAQSVNLGAIERFRMRAYQPGTLQMAVRRTLTTLLICNISPPIRAMGTFARGQGGLVRIQCAVRLLPR